jgi:hypothetical protein
MNSKIGNFLKTSGESIAAKAEQLNAHTRDWQIIKQFLQNRIADISLTKKQEEKLERYQYIYNQSVSGKYTESQIVNSIMTLYKIKLTQAYDDLKCAKEIFSSVININKQFELSLQLQINKKLMIKAECVNDFKALAAFEKNRIQLLAMVEVAEENPADLFEGHNIEAVFDPSLIGAASVDLPELMRVINEKRKIKINPALFEHLVYTDIPNE